MTARQQMASYRRAVPWHRGGFGMISKLVKDIYAAHGGTPPLHGDKVLTQPYQDNAVGYSGAPGGRNMTWCALPWKRLSCNDKWYYD
jgi:hypothetical protein